MHEKLQFRRRLRCTGGKSSLENKLYILYFLKTLQESHEEIYTFWEGNAALQNW